MGAKRIKQKKANFMENKKSSGYMIDPPCDMKTNTTRETQRSLSVLSDTTNTPCKKQKRFVLHDAASQRLKSPQPKPQKLMLTSLNEAMKSGELNFKLLNTFRNKRNVHRLNLSTTYGSTSNNEVGIETTRVVLNPWKILETGFKRITTLDLSNIKLDKKDYAAISRLPLTRLSISNCRVDSLERLSKLKSLTFLDVSYNPIKQLSSVLNTFNSLQLLCINDTEVTLTELFSLTNLSKYKVIVLPRTVESHLRMKHQAYFTRFTVYGLLSTIEDVDKLKDEDLVYNIKSHKRFYPFCSYTALRESLVEQLKLVLTIRRIEERIYAVSL